MSLEELWERLDNPPLHEHSHDLDLSAVLDKSKYLKPNMRLADNIKFWPFGNDNKK